MKNDSTAFVSVVTPVYNGEKYIKECIESVLSQTYKNWEYIIQNNFSSDRTPTIVEKFAKIDNRIKVHHTEKLLPIIENWNLALRKISTESKYCKVVHADDLLYPECLEKLISAAEESQNIGIVGSYGLKGDRVKFDGLPIEKKIIPGKEVCRRTLRREMFLFGSPTTLLYRSDIIRGRNDFYNERFLHADTEVCYDVLRNYDFGFVHQVLSYTRLHEQSQTELTAAKNNTNMIEYLGMLKKHGPCYLDANEYKHLEKKNLKLYYVFLARKIIQFCRKAFRENQKKYLQNMGYRFSAIKLLYHFVLIMADDILNPKRTMSRIVRNYSDRKSG